MTCADCKHCYVTEADGWKFSAPFEAFNLKACCRLIRPDQGHVGSYVGMGSPICKKFEQAQHPVRVYPPETSQMRKERKWWTDIEPIQKLQQLESEKIPAQRSLEAFL